MPPVTSKKQPREPVAAAPLRGGGGGQGGRGKGNGNGKSNGKGYDVASSSAPTSDRRDIFVGNEDRAAKVRKINMVSILTEVETIESHALFSHRLVVLLVIEFSSDIFKLQKMLLQMHYFPKRM